MRYKYIYMAFKYLILLLNAYTTMLMLFLYNQHLLIIAQNKNQTPNNADVLYYFTGTVPVCSRGRSRVYSAE